jgi:hypothetical protein
MRRYTKYIVLVFIILIAGLYGGYAGWNAADPQNTCAGCHEINPSFHTWQASAHRNISCTECHGTALSNGLHSLKEKGNMVLTHFTGNKRSSDVRLNEDQLTETMKNCIRCHQTEFSKWQSGGHSANYARIFLNEAHNKMEQPYWDCLRCHGMFYDGTIYDLLKPASEQGNWKLADEKVADRPVVPCFACHQIHSDNEPIGVQMAWDDRDESIRMRKEKTNSRNPAPKLFSRTDKMYFRADQLPNPAMNYNGKIIKTSDNPIQRVCMQCHAPNFKNISGSEDDRTPRGVHEGLSCTSCHEVHSNNASRSCISCHPAISNCGLDVKTMNTTFADKTSKNNIHFVSCEDCHTGGHRKGK